MNRFAAVALALAAGAALALPAARATATPPPPPRPHVAPATVVPEVMSGLQGCTPDNRTLLAVRFLVLHGSTYTEELQPLTRLRVEYWFDEGWRTATLSPWDDKHVLAAWRTMRWRAYLVDDRGRRVVTGPEGDVQGDSCAVIEPAPRAAPSIAV